MWRLAGLSIAVLAIACSGDSEASDPRSSTVVPTANPTAVPAVVTATAIAASITPTPTAADLLTAALRELDQSWRETGGRLGVPNNVPEGYELVSAKRAREIGEAGPSAHLQYRDAGSSGLIFLDVRQYPLWAFSEARNWTADDAPIKYRSVVQLRQNPDAPFGQYHRETADEAGFSLAFEYDGSIFDINGEIHACLPTCGFSWCAEDDCRTFPEPVIRAIAKSIEPYSGR